MTGSAYDTKDIATARQTIGAEAGKFGSVGDGIPDSVSAGMFGTLANSAAVAQAASALCASVRAEYSKAETLVGAIERTLDANVTNHAGAETGNKKTFTAEQV